MMPASFRALCTKDYKGRALHTDSMAPPSRTQPLLLLLLLTHTASATVTNGKVVQFIVYAEQQSDVARIFPGAHVDHSWNNLFIVTIWTNDADTLIKDLKVQLDANAATLQTIIPMN